MKRTIKNVLVVAALAVSGLLSAQQSIFVGDKVEALVGSKVRVSDKHEELQKYGYSQFYSASTMAWKSQYKFSKKSYTTPYKELNGKEFSIVGFTKPESSSYTGLILYNDEIGNIYFKYSFINKHASEDLTLIEPSENFYSAQISKKVDKFENETVYRTDILQPISFTRIDGENESSVFLSLETGGSTVNVNISGVKILLENGETLEFDNKVDVRVSEGYKYSSFIRLDKNTIDKLSTYAITDFRLYIYDQSIEDGSKYKELLKAIIGYDEI